MTEDRRNALKKIGLLGAAAALLGAGGIKQSSALTFDGNGVQLANVASPTYRAENLVYNSTLKQLQVSDDRSSAYASLLSLPFVVVSPNGPDEFGDFGSNTPTTSTAGIQEAINSLSSGGIVFLRSGIYSVGAIINIPVNLSFHFIGSGVPSWPYLQSNGATFNTPTDGTQIRGTTFFNSQGYNTPIFNKLGAGGTRSGELCFENLAIMPAWGSTVSINPSSVYCVKDNTTTGSLIHRYDNVMFVPWGWAEAASPTPNGNYNFNAFNVALGGTGAGFYAGTIWEIGLNSDNISNVDHITINSFLMNNCLGTNLVASSGFNINDFHGFCVPTPYITVLSGGGSGGILNRITHLFVEGFKTPSNYLIDLTADSSQMMQLDQVYIYGVSDNRTAMPAMTSADSAQLFYPCRMWTGQGGRQQVKTYPLPVATGATSFGDTIANPLNTSATYTIGSGGSSSTLVSARTYKVAGYPIDVTIAAGSSQTITTKDEFGNIVDNAVATLSHRVLYLNWTITVTFVSAGTLTVVQATIGNIQGIAGTTATSQLGVNYVVQKRLMITDTISTGTMTILDGSTNTGGNTLESAIPVPLYRLLEAGMIVSFGTAAPVAGTNCTVVQQ